MKNGDLGRGAVDYPERYCQKKSLAMRGLERKKRVRAIKQQQLQPVE